MALIKCEDCGHEVSNRAPACPKCGAPVQPVDAIPAPENVTTEGEDFLGTRAQITALAVKAVHAINYKVDAADEATGLVSFTTGMSMGSWSGVSGSVYLEEIGTHRFRASGSAKQNVRGGQMVALDLFGESKGKVRKVIDKMRQLAD